MAAETPKQADPPAGSAGVLETSAPVQEDSAPEPVSPPSLPSLPSPPSIADGVERRLDPRSVRLHRIVGWITTGVIGLVQAVALAIAYVAASPPGWVAALLAALWGAVTLGFAWFGHRWPAIEHRHTSYKVDEQGIEIRRGVVWRKVINVPRSRVQHTDVSQGPLERGLGLGTLVIYTAGTDYARVDLGGLDHATALRIRDHLLPKGGENAGDAV